MSVVAEVSVITSAQLAAMASAPPLIAEMTESLFETPIDAATPDAPAPDVAPIASTAENVAAPQVPDGAADMTALLSQSSVQTSVSIESPTVDMPEIAVESAPLMPQNTPAGNERNTTATLLRPPAPRAAPRIDTTPAAPSPAPADLAPVARPETAPVIAPDAVPVDPVTATAPPEATTAIQPDAQPDAEISAMPVRRPRNMAAAAQQVEADAEIARRAVAQAQEAAAQAEAEQQSAVDAQTAAIEAALRQAAAQVASSTQTATLSGPEAMAIGAMVSANWNKQLLLEQPNYEQYVVRISVPLDAQGNLTGPIEAIEPLTPEGYFKIAFASAERAVRQALPIELPPARFSTGATLILRFDPVSGIGFN